MSLRSTAAGAAKWTALSTVVTAATNLLIFAFLARLLTQSEMGLIAIMVVVMALVDVFVGLGLPAALIHRRGVTSRQASSVHWLVVGSNSACGLLLILLAGLLSDFFSQPDLKMQLIVVAAVFVINGFGQIPKASLEKRLQFGRVASAEISYAVLQLVAAVAFAHFGFGSWSYVLALVLSSAVRVSLWAYLGRRTFRPRFVFGWSSTKPFLSFGVYQAADGLVNYLTNNFSAIALGKILGPGPLSGYTLAYNVAVQLPAKVNPIITRVAFPLMAKMQGEQSRVVRTYLQINRICALISAPVLIGLALVSGDFMSFMYGEPYRSYEREFAILCLVGLLRAYGNPLGSMLNATGRVKLGFSLNSIRACLSIPITIWMTIEWGSLGAALSMLISGLLGFCVGAICSRVVLSVKLRTYAAGLFWAVLPALPMAVFLVGFQLFLPTNLSNWTNISIQAVVALFIYLISIWTLCREPFILSVKSRIIRNVLEFKRS
ncbi:MOP flippase family protein [Arthrobacter sp. MYb227]|uniref:MOP flippase family protein n=1 Tax=Arthrobacter sp. MYb227 TaxID=1848601 RepID=UPI0015E308B5|nr:MOP flippase family protein [Arthrobacter sp. MYb227]